MTDTIIAKVTLLLPVNNAVTTDTTPTLTWQAISDSVGVDSYVVEIARDTSFAQTLHVDTRNGTFTDSTTKELIGDTHYYWRVKAIDDLANAGAYSETFAFKVDTSFGVALVSPTVAHDTTNANIVFQWSGSNVDTYIFQISQVSTFASILAQQVFDAATDTTFKLPREDTYFWRVGVISTVAVGALTDTTATQTVLLDTHASQVTVSAPADGTETTALSIPVSWAILDDSVGIDSFVVEASKGTSFATTVFADTVDGTATTDYITGTYNDTYFWRVRAIDDLANVGPNSATRGFVVDTLVNVTTLSQPADAHETTNTSIVLSWTAVSDSVGLDSYAIELSKNSNFTMMAINDTFDAATASRTASPLYNDTYFWHVRAIDDLGNVSAHSTARGFVVDTHAPRPDTMLPVNGHETTVSQVVVSWTAGSDSVGIDSFALEVSKNTNFTSLTFSDTIDGARTSDTVTNLYIDTYYWRVRTIDDLANNSAYSATGSFRSDTNVRFGTVQMLTKGGSVATTYKAIRHDSIVIEVNDTDPNANTGAVDSVQVWLENVTFNSEGNAEYETATLGELSANASVFRESFPISLVSSSHSAAASGKLFVRPGDVVRVNYLDSPRLILVTATATIEGGGTTGDSLVFDTGNHHILSAGGSMTFRIAAYDTTGDTVSNATVSYTVDYNGSNAAGGATLSPTSSTTTGSNGFTSSITLTLGSGNGIYVVTATSASSRQAQIVVYTDKRDVPANTWVMFSPFKRPDQSLTGLGQLSYSGTGLSYSNDPTISSSNATFYRYKSVTGQASPNNSANGEFTKYDTGQAYWFKSTSATSVGLLGTPVVSTASYAKTIMTAGANMIGNPFPHFINWLDDVYVETDATGCQYPLSQLRTTTYIDTKLQWRDHSAGQYLASLTSTGEDSLQIKPWVGYWVKINTACTIVYYGGNKRMPQSTKVKQSAPVYSQGGGDISSWRLQLMAYTGDSQVRDEYNFVGVAPAARNDEDMNDLWKAPGMAGDVQVWIGEPSSPESPAEESGKYYAASIGAPVKTAAAWPVVVTGPTGPVTLKWDASNVPGEFGAVLIGGPSGPVDMKSAASTAVMLSSSVKLTLAVGLPDYLAAFLAAALDKEQSFVYPNPGPDAATGQMTFKYSLPADAPVTLKIYDVAGRLIRELAEPGKAGLNMTLKWDTTNKHGQKVGSGVYIYILESSGNKLIDKLAIVR